MVQAPSEPFLRCMINAPAINILGARKFSSPLQRGSVTEYRIDVVRRCVVGALREMKIVFAIRPIAIVDQQRKLIDEMLRIVGLSKQCPSERLVSRDGIVHAVFFSNRT